MNSVCVFKKKTGVTTCHNVIDKVTGRTLSRSYGRCIAEFLNEESLVRLWSTRPEHLCRFAVRMTMYISLKAFLVSTLIGINQLRSFVRHR